MNKIVETAVFALVIAIVSTRPKYGDATEIKPDRSIITPGKGNTCKRRTPHTRMAQLAVHKKNQSTTMQPGENGFTASGAMEAAESATTSLPMTARGNIEHEERVDERCVRQALDSMGVVFNDRNPSLLATVLHVMLGHVRNLINTKADKLILLSPYSTRKKSSRACLILFMARIKCLWRPVLCCALDANTR